MDESAKSPHDGAGAPSETPSAEQLMQRAIELHQAGNLMEAGLLYKSILESQPSHPEANHHLGVIAVQAEQPAAGLPYFMAALDSDPSCSAYWLDYIDALLRSGQIEDARSILDLARQHGLKGDGVDALAARMTNDMPSPKATNTSPTQDNPAAVSHVRHGRSPKERDIQALITLFNQQRYVEMERLARTMTRNHSQHEFGWKMLGIALQLQGNSRAAIAPMQQAVKLSPDDVESHYNLGVAFQELGQLEDAEKCYRQSLALNPRYGDATLNLGVVYHRLHKLEDAEKSLRQAISIKPNSAKAHGNLGATLEDMGRLAEAEASFRRSLTIAPHSPVAHINLGGILRKQGNLSEAETCFRKALDIDPNYAEAHADLAITFREQDRLEDAETSMRTALRIRPNDAKLHNNLALILQAQGRLDEADAHMQISLHIAPENAESLGNRGNLLRHMGRQNEATACYRQALQVSPDDAGLLVGLGDIHRLLSNYGEAESCYRKALQHTPDNLNTLCSLGITLNLMGQLDQAEICFKSLLSKNPDNPIALSSLGLVLQGLGRLEEASTYLRQACSLAPNYAPLYSNWLYCLLLSEPTNMDMVFRKHNQFGERFENPLESCRHSHTLEQDPERNLRVGFVSADLFCHAVFNFIEPVLSHIKKHIEVSLYAYYNNYIDDACTQHLKGLFDYWVTVANLSDNQLAERVGADNIDILIDLSGHTAGHRLLTFALKPAPLQASWIGYPGTTGMRSIDYYLADRYMLPPGRFDNQFTEKIVRLPANAPFQPFVDAPAVNHLPALSNGFMTFGSFNRSNKLSREVIALWSKLLRALPDSLMVLGGMQVNGLTDKLADWFAEEGITRNRLEFHPRDNMANYMALHHLVDICLDTFPYNGGTTTLHAMWMGVPTLTLSGQNMAGRVGTAAMLQIGVNDFVADCPEEFVANGLYWAGNLASLNTLRIGLRDLLIQTPLLKSELIAAGLAHALRKMWQRRCAGLAPESFEVSRQDLNLDL